MVTKQRFSKLKVPATTWVIAFMVISAVMAAEHLTPFGNRNLLISDMGTQYMAFLTSLRHSLLVHDFQLYSFSQSLGNNVVPTVAYYLMSPFNLIIIFFKANQVPIAVSVIIMLKIATIAFTMAYFLQQHFQTRRWGIILFAIAFSMSGFVAVNYFDIMWLDALIWLPLVINGVDHLMRTGKTAPFFWWLLISIVTDFYLGYMTALFVICYFVYAVFEQNQGQLKLAALLKHNAYLIGNILITSILSVLSALFILIPTALGMLQTAKTTRSISDYFPWPTFGAEFFSQLGVGASNYSNRLSHAPTVFSSTLVVLLVMWFFVNSHISQQSKKYASWLLAFLFISMFVRTLNTAWHMFQQPEGFPFRNAFFFSFIMILLATQSWLANPQKIRQRWQVIMPSILGGLLIIGWASSRIMPKLVAKHWPGAISNYVYATNVMPTRNLLLGLVYVALTTFALLVTYHRLQKILLGLIVTTELGGNFLLSMHGTHFGSQSAFEKAYQTEQTQMQSVNDPDGQLYRVDNANTLINQAYKETYNNYNDPLLFNFHDINSYSSTLNNATRLTLHSLGLFSRNARRISSAGLTPVTAMLLGVKYNVTLRNTTQNTESNLGYLGIGFPVSNQFISTKLSSSNALKNQEALLQSLRTSSTPYYAAAKIGKTNVKATTGKVYHYRQTIHLTTSASGPLYLDDTSGVTKYSTMTVDGQRLSQSVDTNHFKRIVNLGSFKKGTSVTVKLTTMHHAYNSKLQMKTLNTAEFGQVIKQQQSTGFTPTYHATGTTTSLIGTVNNQNHRQWLYLALPADQGWSARVNGQTVTTKKVLGGLTAIPINAGKNKIQLTYVTPGLHLGIGISLLSMLVYLTYGWWRKRRSAV